MYCTCKVLEVRLKIRGQLYSTIQNFHLGKYIVGYTVRNSVLRQHVSGAIEYNFQEYVQ